MRDAISIETLRRFEAAEDIPSVEVREFERTRPGSVLASEIDADPPATLRKFRAASENNKVAFDVERNSMNAGMDAMTITTPKGTEMRATPLAVVLIAVLLGACSGQNEPFRHLGWFEPVKPPVQAPSYATFPQSKAELGVGPVEGRIRNALDLADAKRFSEARGVLADLAGDLAPGTPIWTAVKCAEMSVAIRGNDLAALPGMAEAVERGMADPLRPPAECLRQIAVARAIAGRPMPLGVSESLASTLRHATPRVQAKATGSTADDLPPVLVSKGGL